MILARVVSNDSHVDEASYWALKEGAYGAFHFENYGGHRIK